MHGNGAINEHVLRRGNPPLLFSNEITYRAICKIILIKSIEMRSHGRSKINAMMGHYKVHFMHILYKFLNAAITKKVWHQNHIAKQGI